MNLKKFIEDKKMSKREVASVLFPKVKHPGQALRRVLRGESELRDNQIQALHRMLGNYDTMEFTIVPQESAQDRITLQYQDYTANLDFVNGLSTITYKGDLISCSMVHSKYLNLNEYLRMVKENIDDNLKSKNESINNIF